MNIAVPCFDMGQANSYAVHTARVWSHLSISYAWIALYAAGPLAADDEASMFELLLLGGGVLLFCLLIAYERLTNRL